MESITKTKVTRDQIFKMIIKAFGEENEVETIQELTEGFFNTAYLIIFKNGFKSVLKVSPVKEVKVMRYENNIMEAEVFTLNTINNVEGVPVPKVLFYDKSQEIINCEYFFMEFVKGESLDKIRKELTEEQYNDLSSQLGKYAKKINHIEGDYFGSIAQTNKRFSTWSEAFLNMIKDLLDDAEKMKVSLPYTSDNLYSIISQYQQVLNRVKKPSLVHKDLWEGNIFYNHETSKITGIIDCERALYGDRLLEPVCGFLLENEHFMAAFLEKNALDKDEYLRVIMYKVYLFLLMVIEGAYRQYPDKGIEEWARAQLSETLDILIHMEDSVLSSEIDAFIYE